MSQLASKTMAKEVSTWPKGAMIRMKRHRDGFAMTCPAAFLYATADGFAWAEPAYADPYGYPGHAGHRLVAEVFRTAEGFKFGGAEWRGEIVPYRGEVQELGECMDWFNAWMNDQGRTWSNERRRVRRMMGELLTTTGD
jgi:hypothetical protein